MWKANNDWVDMLITCHPETGQMIIRPCLRTSGSGNNSPTVGPGSKLIAELGMNWLLRMLRFYKTSDLVSKYLKKEVNKYLASRPVVVSVGIMTVSPQ